MKSISAILVFLLAEGIATYMGDERLVLVLQVISITFLMAGFNNIGMVLHQKKFHYRPQFIIQLTSRIVGFIAKITLAIELNNYWAFIIAQIIEVTISLIASYIAHPFRPSLSLLNCKQQWLFSQWIILKSIFVFFRFRIDKILLSKFLTLDSLGVYTVSMDLATLPAGQIIAPAMEPLYVGLSEIYEDKKLLADKVHKTLSLLFIIVLPVSVGIYVTSENLVYIMLGESWKSAPPLVATICFVLIPGVIGDFFTRIMTAMGKVKLIFKFEFVLGLLTIGIFVFLADRMTVIDFAELRVITTSLNTLIVFLVLTYMTGISFL